MARGVLLQCIMGGYPEARFMAVKTVIWRWCQTRPTFIVCPGVHRHGHWPFAMPMNSGNSSALSTRGQLKAVIARYAAHGLAPVVATELEFFVFAPNPDPTQAFRPPVGLDGRREDGSAAFSISSNNGLRPFFSEVYASMAALGLPRDTVMHEMGVSQFEINLLHGDALLPGRSDFYSSTCSRKSRLNTA